MMVDNEKFTFADLFAGVGGMRIAFEQVGGECVLTSENNDNALKTYTHNFPETKNHILIKDVNKLQAKDFPTQPGELGVLIAGFPCQPYSITGLRKGLEDDRGGEIFTSILRLLKTVQPKSFLLENVKGIKSHDNGNTFKYMLDELSKQGYHLKSETLNSKTHANIPQNRERVFVVGFRSPVAAEKFTFPTTLPLTATLQDCLETDKVDERYYYNGISIISEQVNKEVTKPHTIYQHRRSYVRENKSGVCPTLTANMGSGGNNIPIIRDNYGVRKLTPRETANFQGFPQNYKLPNIANSHLYHQFGNSVTVPLITRIAKQIVIALE